MTWGLNNEAKIEFAKSFTELAIQNNLFTSCENSADTAKQITTFFNTVVNFLGSESPESN